MARREFIETREIVYVNAPIAPILQGDSIHYEDIAFKAQIGRIRTFPEQEIVKPYLDKIRVEIEKERVYDDWDFGQEIYYNKAIDDVLEIIDKYREESEDK